MSILQRLIEREFGVKTTCNINPVVGAVGVIPILVLQNNPNRLAWTFLNLSAGWLSLGFDRDVSNTYGIYIASGGGGINFLWKEEFELVGWQLFAVAQNAASPIYVVEIVATSEDI